jgi:hypothetical protein
MRAFLTHVILFLCLVGGAVVLYCWYHAEYFPAPRLTQNISLNEQLKRVKLILEGRVDHSPGGTVDVLAVGSSMTLNNLHSQGVVEHFGASYVNVGSWSTRIHLTTRLTDLLIGKLKPHTLILTSNMEDWMKGEDRYDLDPVVIDNYLTRWGHAASYLRTLRPAYYLREMERNKVRMKDPTYYDFLGFDPWGGASINVPPERVEADRNVYTIPRPDQLDHSLYPHLEELSEIVREQGVRMIFIQSPYRAKDNTDELRGILNEHEQKVRRILEPAGHVFVSTTDTIWPDDMFIDPSHFRAEGALQFTRYALGKLEPHWLMTSFEDMERIPADAIDRDRNESPRSFN